MTKRAALARYLEERRALVALRRQLVQYPELKDNPPWRREFDATVVRANEYQRSLTGGQLGEAERALRAEGL